jgi:hypothetical protein
MARHLVRLIPPSLCGLASCCVDFVNVLWSLGGFWGMWGIFYVYPLEFCPSGLKEDQEEEVEEGGKEDKGEDEGDSGKKD